MPRPLPLLLVMARESLSLTQTKLAKLVGSSARSVQRWENERASPAAWHVQALADAVREHEPALGDELDAWAPRPQPPAVAAAAEPVAIPARAEAALPTPPPIPQAVLVDAIVCAAAEAMSLPPQHVRAALLAAFRRALDARLTPADVVSVLDSGATAASTP